MTPRRAGQDGEYIRGHAVIEAQERDRLANFAAKAVAAGLAEREVRVAERQMEFLAAMVLKAITEANVPAPLAAALKASISRQARDLTTG